MLAQRSPWAIGLCVIGAILLWAVITLFVALFGLGQIGPNIDLGTLPAWLWYYRGDPLLGDWIKRGAMAGAAVVALLVLTILRRGPSLHGRARQHALCPSTVFCASQYGILIHAFPPHR